MEIDENEIFEEDVRNCTAERESLVDFEITDPALETIHKLFADADAVSRENYAKTNIYRLSLAICGVFITFLFINYGEGRIDNLLITSLCCLSIGILIITKWWFDHKKRHRKHLQYRVFAESLRAQFYMYYAGIDESVVNMLPWAIRDDLKWIVKRLSELPKPNSAHPEAILLFCQNQIAYHNKIINYDKFYKNSYENLTKIVLVITIILYFVALAFDIYIAVASPKGWDLNETYFYIKLFLGMMTILTLLLDNFFGKMSLNTRVKDHERRIELYDKVSNEIVDRIDDTQFVEERFKCLIGEFLIENSTWYVYESQNKLSYVL